MAAVKDRPLQSRNAANVAAAAPPESVAPGSGNCIEEIYSVEKHTQTLWVYENGEMVHRSVSYVPGLLYIFDEILERAVRTRMRDLKMDSLNVSIDVENNVISVFFTGKLTDTLISMTKEESFFYTIITEIGFPNPRSKRGRRSQTFPLAATHISSCQSWTRVTLIPDLAKLNVTELEGDVVALMKKRVVDMAGIFFGRSGVRVELNGKCIPVKSFGDYVSLYLQAASKSRSHAASLPMIADRSGSLWEVCVSLSEVEFEQVSFVNRVATIKGGTHFDHVTSQISNYLLALINKNGNANIKAHTVRSYLWVFVNAMICNPTFDSPTKETLTTSPKDFGYSWLLSDEFLKKVEKSVIVAPLLRWANIWPNKQKVVGNASLVDAKEAGGKNSEKCTLILTVGDFAMSLALAGISAVGRDHFGVYSLTKKLLNAREDSSYDQLLMENAEVQHIKHILGLQDEKEYDSVKSLRYGHLMIMTNQDPDGSHAKGLLIYFIHSFWPSLLRVRSFLVDFIAPIVKATHRDGMVRPFNSILDYESWRESLQGDASSWTIKYYHQGFGSSTPEEVKEYFIDLDRHKRDFVWEDEQDDVAIKLAFSEIIAERKDWLRQFEPGSCLYQKKKNPTVRFKDFVNEELILFPMEKLRHMIPSMVDGLKPFQRKILFSCLKLNLVKQLLVTELSHYVIQHSAYHHRESKLASTIIGMAQNFVGSNNINLLHPTGRFGSRHHGCKNHAGASYVHVKLSPITRYLFHKDDDILLDYLNEYGDSIEPTWYMPVIPTVLVNGSEGTGTEWRTYIPKYNPRDIVANIRHFLNGELMEPMHPWYKGFIGNIEKSATEEGGYTCTGIIEVINETTLRITELPVGQCTEEYMEWLYTKLIGHEKAKEPFIKDILERNGDTTVCLELVLSHEEMDKVNTDGLVKKFNLTTEISTSNMHLLDSKGVIKKYDTPEQIVEEFYQLRLAYYEKRKKALGLELENKVRFINEVQQGNILVVGRERADVIDELRKKGFLPFPMAGASDVIDERKEFTPVSIASGILGGGKRRKYTPFSLARGEWWSGIVTPSWEASDYDYLLSLLDDECNVELHVEEDCLNKFSELNNMSPKSLWIQDLNALDSELNEQDKLDGEDDDDAAEMEIRTVEYRKQRKPQIVQKWEQACGMHVTTA